MNPAADFGLYETPDEGLSLKDHRLLQFRSTWIMRSSSFFGMLLLLNIPYSLFFSNRVINTGTILTLFVSLLLGLFVLRIGKWRCWVNVFEFDLLQQAFRYRIGRKILCSGSFSEIGGLEIFSRKNPTGKGSLHTLSLLLNEKSALTVCCYSAGQMALHTAERIKAFIQKDIPIKHLDESK